jgi:hypothetical protein
MAALDRRLRRGERALSGLDAVSAFVSRFGEAVREASRAAARTRAGSDTPGPSTDAGAV